MLRYMFPFLFSFKTVCATGDHRYTWLPSLSAAYSDIFAVVC